MKLLFVVAAMIAAFALNAQTKFESAMQRGLGMIMRHMPIYKAHG